MASESLSIQNALLTLIRGISGYADTTSSGYPPEPLPPAMPRAYLIAEGPWTFDWGSQYADLRSQGVVTRWRVVLLNTLATDIADTPEAREEVALTAMEALLSAIAANPTLTATVPEISVEVEPFIATQRSAGPLVGCFGTITAIYTREP